MIRRWSTALFALLLFLVPSNVFLQLNQRAGFVAGLRIDYLIPKLHLTDMVVLVLLPLLAWQHQQLFQKNWQFWLPWLILGITFIRPGAELAGIRIWILVCLAWLVTHSQSLWQAKISQWAVVGAVIFQSVIGWYQFGSQQSVAGYWFLGESDLQSYAGIARVYWQNQSFIAPYGTTAHPNVLAGFLAAYCFILFWLQKNRQLVLPQTALILALGCAAATIFLTQSASAMAVLLLVVVMQYLPRLSNQSMTVIFLSLMTISIAIYWILPSNLSELSSLRRRAQLLKATPLIMSQQPWWGTGLQRYSAAYAQLAFPSYDQARFVQPVHHTIVLLWAEIGTVGFALLLLLAATKLNQKTLPELLWVLVLFSPIIFFDHYLLSIQSGRLLIFVVGSMICTFAGSPLNHWMVTLPNQVLGKLVSGLRQKMLLGFFRK